jgi:hypothetical protein
VASEVSPSVGGCRLHRPLRLGVTGVAARAVSAPCRLVSLRAFLQVEVPCASRVHQWCDSRALVRARNSGFVGVTAPPLTLSPVRRAELGRFGDSTSSSRRTDPSPARGRAFGPCTELQDHTWSSRWISEMIACGIVVGELFG